MYGHSVIWANEKVTRAIVYNPVTGCYNRVRAYPGTGERSWPILSTNEYQEEVDEPSTTH